MVYPGRKILDVLPEFAGTATVRQSPEQRECAAAAIRLRTVLA